MTRGRLMFRPDAEDGLLRRFEGAAPHANRAAAELRRDHPAVVEGRTMFRKGVRSAEEAPRLLVSGHNNPKLGARVRKGRWAGMPIVHLTLEERATCPRSCHLWHGCYGNAMPFARRHTHGPELEALLSIEIDRLADQNPSGFVVRLHTLGDFYSVRYAARWAVWLAWVEPLHVFGFTAWGDDTPIGQMIERMNGRWPDRCAIRFSRATPSGQGWEATTIWRKPEAPLVAEGLVCPAQTERTAACATCGLCWTAGNRTIVFIGHGRRVRGQDAAA